MNKTGDVKPACMRYVRCKALHALGLGYWIHSFRHGEGTSYYGVNLKPRRLMQLKCRSRRAIYGGE